MNRRLVAIAALAVAAALVVPALTSGPNLDSIALSLALAGPAAGAAIAAATGRPVLSAAAFGGVAAYVSAILSLHAVPVPAAVVCGALAGALAGALVAALGVHLDGVAFLVMTLLFTLACGAGVQSLPLLLGAQSGLGPLTPLSLPLGTSRLAVLTPLGDFHTLLAVAALSTAVAVVVLTRGPGPRWRAIGSDRSRAAASGLRPFVGEITALAVAGLLAGLSGGLVAHVARIASPTDFALDVGALPLLAALAAGREPLGAALVAVGTGLVGHVLLPAAGWLGPPDAQSLALGILAVAALFTLLPGRGAAAVDAGAAIDAGAPWPLDGLGLSGAALTVGAIAERTAAGAPLVDAPPFSVPAAGIHAVVGPNGAGKSTLLRAIATRFARRDASVDATVPGAGGRARVVLLPQEGGGFAACTVSETLRLAARRGRSRVEAARLADAWASRLGLAGSGTRMCIELSAGQRRLLDLARVLLNSPNVVLCDEPLAGLDDGHRAAAVSCLRAMAAEGLTVVLAEHDREAVAALAGSVTELDRADLISRAPAPAASA